MAVRWFVYLAALSGCGVFYIAYGEWFSFLALVLMLALPWLSLVLSLPAMLTTRVTLEGAEKVPMNAPAEVWLQGSCPLPMPVFRGRIRLRRCFTGELLWYSSARGLPTDHCGAFLAAGETLDVCDYLGLFALPVRCPDAKTIRIRPEPVPIRELPALDRYLARSWRPKFGGGFAENHELRLYRPGDNLNQIHWKLTAKTGKWMLREPMEPQRGLVLVTMDLMGTPEELDRKLGRLLWLGGYLLEKNLPFQLRVLTGDGVQSAAIADEAALLSQLDMLLCQRLATEGSVADLPCAASWQYHIGGDADEA